MEQKTEFKKEFIECECGAHVLQISTDVEYFDSTNSDVKPGRTRFRQEFWLAMFSYGNYHKRLSVWRRLRIIWNYLRTGKMHEDQIIMEPEEAKKLANFINNNYIEGEY